MQARYYDPVIGRFYSNDPVDALGHLSTLNGIHGFNRYAYANNNPYRYTDPTGMASFETTRFDRLSGEQAIQVQKQIGEGIIEASGINDVVDSVKSVLSGDLKGAATSAVIAVAKPVKVANKVSKVFSKEKQALVDMAKSDKKNGGVTQGDMDAYKELNSELSDPFPSNKVRGLESHPNRPHGKEPHGHVGPVNHIPEKKI